MLRQAIQLLKLRSSERRLPGKMQQANGLPLGQQRNNHHGAQVPNVVDGLDQLLESRVVVMFRQQSLEQRRVLDLLWPTSLQQFQVRTSWPQWDVRDGKLQVESLSKRPCYLGREHDVLQHQKLLALVEDIECATNDG